MVLGIDLFEIYEEHEKELIEAKEISRYEGARNARNIIRDNLLYRAKQEVDPLKKQWMEEEAKRIDGPNWNVLQQTVNNE